MLNAISISSQWVLDQDEALEFYVGKLGLEVHTDADLGFMRWLTVNVPGEPGRELLLTRPGPPALDEATAEQVRELVTKGALGTVIFRTDDCRKTYEELRARGVEFIDEPTERPYGIDCALRDPSVTPSAYPSPPNDSLVVAIPLVGSVIGRCQGLRYSHDRVVRFPQRGLTGPER